MATVIDGKQVAASVIDTVKAATAALEKQSGIQTGLAVIIVGDDPASHAYVGSKSKMAKECGFKSVQHTLPVETTQQELAALVASLNADDTIHGILVQLPLPKHLNSEAIIPVDPAGKGCRWSPRRQRRQAGDRRSRNRSRVLHASRRHGLRPPHPW
jgi:methylenetetrahydrofolate dehydrogenase (NADP+)/methenyltetrahydrofolate cyclohydrolase